MSMAGYTKLFNSILASTIWRSDDKTRIVWITLLAMSDKDGICEGSVPGLADLARVSIEDCESALAELMAPDKYSRTTEFEGRRIEPVDGGWLLLNHSKYRAKMSEDDLREKNRQRQAKWREKHKSNANSNAESQDVTPSHTKSRQSRHTDTYTDTKAEAKANTHNEERGVVVNGKEAFTTSSSSEQSEAIFDGLRQRLRCVILPRETEWLQQIDWAMANSFTPEQFLGCYDFLKNQEWRTSPVRAEHVATALPDFAKDSSSSTSQWQIDRDNCKQCDERGYVLLDGKHQVCKH